MGVSKENSMGETPINCAVQKCRDCGREYSGSTCKPCPYCENKPKAEETLKACPLWGKYGEMDIAQMANAMDSCPNRRPQQEDAGGEEKARWAKQIIKCRDAIIREDMDEAYHALYELADPTFEKHIPENWAGLEAIAEPTAQEDEGEEKHPEDTCQRCGRDNPTWYAENELWNSVILEKQRIICPRCFKELAQERGVHTALKCYDMRQDNREMVIDDLQAKLKEAREWIKEMEMRRKDNEPM